MTNISIQDRINWIGASEVAALFGLHKQITLFELWNIKAGNMPAPDLSSNDRVFWGNVLEPAIAAGIAKKMGWNVRNVRRYIEHKTVKGMGASLDYEIVSHPKGPGVLEIKTVDWLEYKNWPDGEPTLSYQLQLQDQLACTGRSWGAIGVLIGGNDLKVFEYDRHDKTIAKLENEIAAFWVSIASGKCPEPDFERDAATIAALSINSDGEVMDARGDNYLTALCNDYHEAATKEREAKKAKDAAKAEILIKIGNAPKALVDGFSISAGTVAENHVSFKCPAYRNLRITKKKEATNEQQAA